LQQKADGVSEYKWEVIGVSNVIRLSSSFANGNTGRRANRSIQHGLDDSTQRGAGCAANFAAPDGDNVFAIRPDAATFLQEDEMLEQLDRRDRMRLVKFVCSFAWADLEIQPEERVFISRLIRRLDLGEDDDLQVQHWLDRPPELDDLDPTSIPAAHRRFFVEAIEGLISADGEIAEEESDSFEIFKQLLAN
jgi:uncharacterized tellurite resistance protein B-like protein